MNVDQTCGTFPIVQTVFVMKMDRSLSNVTEIQENVLAKRILWMTNVQNVKLNITTSPIAKNASVGPKVL
jgi:hypothetical protein